MISFDCPKCHQIVTGPDTLAGKVAKCAKCGQRLQVPSPPGRPVPPVPPSPGGWRIGSLLVPALGGAALAALAALVLLPMMFFPNLNPFKEKAETSKPAAQVVEQKPTEKAKVQTESPPKEETKAEVKPEAKIEPKPEPKEMPKAEPKPEPGPGPGPGPGPEPQGITALIKQLKDKDEVKRLRAAKKLEKMGPAAKEAIPALTEALKDPDEDVRAIAQRALDKLQQPAAKSDVAVLVKRLKDTDETVRLEAAKKLGQMGAEAADAIPALTAALKDKDADVRRVAGQSLENIQLELAAKGVDPAMAAILRRLLGKKVADRVKAASELAQMGEKARHVSGVLIMSMLDSWPTNKEEFLDALENINPKLHKPVLTLLIDEDVRKRLQALEKIAELRAEGRAATPLLLKLCQTGQQSNRSRSGYVAQKAFLVMTKVDPQNKVIIQTVLAAVPANLRVVDDDYFGKERPFTSNPTPIAIAQEMKIEPKLLVPALIQALGNPQAKNEAILALATIGPEAKAAVPLLNKLRFDSDSTTRDAAMAALKNIQGK